MRTRADCLKDLKAKHPNATPEELEKKCDEEMDAYATNSNSIRGVEIFDIGTHNGDKYTDRDLDDMVAAFGVLDYRPSVKIGHTKDVAGSPSYGWITNLRKQGTKLVADFESMHDSVIEAIRKKMYNAVSSEIYFNLKRGGKEFRRALKAVALLGAEVPAVAGLKPLHKMEFAAVGEFEKEFASDDAPLTVSAQAMFESLSERMAVLINYQESDMKLRDKQIKKFTDDLAEITKQIAALAGSSDKDKDAKVAELNKKLAEVQTELKTLSEEDDDDTTARALAEQRKENEALQAQLKATQQSVESLTADSRRRAVAEVVGTIKVPAFRPAFEALTAYALLHSAETVKVYSKDKDGKDVTADQSLLTICQGLIGQVNSQAEHLFKVHAANGTVIREDGSEEADPQMEVDKRAKKLVADGKAKLYSEAVAAVLATDTVLAKKYAEGSRQKAVVQ